MMQGLLTRSIEFIHSCIQYCTNSAQLDVCFKNVHLNYDVYWIEIKSANMCVWKYEIWYCLIKSVHPLILPLSFFSFYGLSRPWMGIFECYTESCSRLIRILIFLNYWALTDDDLIHDNRNIS